MVTLDCRYIKSLEKNAYKNSICCISLDVLRSIDKSKGESLKIFMKHIKKVCEKSKKNENLENISSKIQSSIQELCNTVKNLDPDILQTGSREFSFSLYRLFTGLFLLFITIFAIH